MVERFLGFDIEHIRREWVAAHLVGRRDVYMTQLQMKSKKVSKQIEDASYLQ